MKGEKIQLRNMLVSDHGKLIGLWTAAGLEHYPEGRDSLASITRDLKRDGPLFIMAWYGEMLIGSVLCTDDGRKGWINRLAVHPSHRGQGVAKLLIDAAEKHFHSKGIEVFSILVYRSNAPSLQLFHSLGYEDHEETIYLSKRTRPGA